MPRQQLELAAFPIGWHTVDYPHIEAESDVAIWLRGDNDWTCPSYWAWQFLHDITSKQFLDIGRDFLLQSKRNVLGLLGDRHYGLVNVPVGNCSVFQHLRKLSETIENTPPIWCSPHDATFSTSMTCPVHTELEVFGTYFPEKIAALSFDDDKVSLHSPPIATDSCRELSQDFPYRNSVFGRWLQ